jgi:hypothetical protein
VTAAATTAAGDGAPEVVAVVEVDVVAVELAAVVVELDVELADVFVEELP